MSARGLGKSRYRGSFGVSQTRLNLLITADISARAYILPIN